MIRIEKTLAFLFVLLFITQVTLAQDTVPQRVIWAVNKVDLGTILEEQGPQVAEFEFTHTQDSLYYIETVWSDCGCTDVEYTRDTLVVGESGKLQVTYDPTVGVGYFSRMIIVKGNLQGTQDTLFIEGNAIPRSSNPERDYTTRKGKLGFRLEKVNMGEVFTNEPKLKAVEVYNFGEDIIYKDSLMFGGPEYIQVSQLTDSIMPNDRGLLQVMYDGNMKGDLGYFEDRISLNWQDSSSFIHLDVLADVFEYYAPFAKDNLNVVPQLVLDPKEIDLSKIQASEIQVENVVLRNAGRQILEIKKIQGNCDCLRLEIPKTTLDPGEMIELKVVFDPKGRKGIDQRNIYIFSNDPVNPVQLLLLKSRVE
ncbi:DUF1573 domain-containing protein [Algoriphagus halophytocola]|uniref:DUF1573 domain-containing protein n=1 Tax=Algoriphagus halophytocola TaxID=2991499 RepID=A0ABY6MLA2_9BACT|nr:MULTISPECIES: DUF1573 domain-containing protein [unclassified Algoriphagus]UZD23744.1 DUF1573 domain-containing protein [Algoriphagus sp. TR-M5]WBL45038.1 DUF1573 domain-containing protein [Algoriphagus sp. TR-M9]